MRKVLGTENPADLMTKNLARQWLDKCMLQLNQHRTMGRAQASLDIQGKGKTNVNTVSSSDADSGFTGRVNKVDGAARPHSDSDSESTDPEMPELVPLVIPAKRSACAALARLNAKPRDQHPAASTRDGCTTSRLGSLRVCRAEPPMVPRSTPEALHSFSRRADEEVSGGGGAP